MQGHQARAMGSVVVANGLTITAAGFAGCYVLQAMKHIELQAKQVFKVYQNLPSVAAITEVGLTTKCPNKRQH